MFVQVQLTWKEATCYSLMEATHTHIYKVIVIVGLSVLWHAHALRAALKLSKKFFIKIKGQRKFGMEKDNCLAEGKEITVMKYKDNYKARIMSLQVTMIH